MPVPTKKDIRAAVLRARDGLGPEDRARRSSAVGEHLFALPQWPGPGAVLFFHTMRTEVETPPMISRALREGVPVALPRMAPGGKLDLCRILDLSADLEPNDIDILEPRARCLRLSPSGLGIVIVPGVAFDDLGFRIGYGGGYYDRLLAANPRALRVAVAFDLQRVPAVPRKAHDLPVDVLITESGPKVFYRRLVPRDF